MAIAEDGAGGRARVPSRDCGGARRRTVLILLPIAFVGLFLVHDLLAGVLVSAAMQWIATGAIWVGLLGVLTLRA
jgi:hypothetical protein